MQLAASDDIPWDLVLQTASANATDIYDHLFPATFADIQQFLANAPEYLGGTRNFGADLTTAFDAATNPFLPVDPEPYIYPLLDILSNGLKINLGITTVNIDVLSALPGNAEAAQIAQHLPFSGSPLTGIVWGSFGTTVGPLLQINDDLTVIRVQRAFERLRIELDRFTKTAGRPRRDSALQTRRPVLDLRHTS